MSVLRLLAILGVAFFLPASARADTALPIPEGFEAIAGTNGLQYLRTDSTRTNMYIGERVTSASILLFTTLDDGTPVYALSDFVAWCESGRFTRTQTTVVASDQTTVLSVDKQHSEINIADSPNDAAVHTRLCSEWNKND